MKKLKAFFGGLKDPKTSEFYTVWLPIMTAVLCGFSPEVCSILHGALGTAGADPAAVGTASVVYGIGRMTSKAVKA